MAPQAPATGEMRTWTPKFDTVEDAMVSALPPKADIHSSDDLAGWLPTAAIADEAEGGPKNWVGFAFTNQPIHWNRRSYGARLTLLKELAQLCFFDLAIG
jgi:hypothetical protein